MDCRGKWMDVITLVLVLMVLVLALLAYCKWCHSYWYFRGVPTPPSVPFFGHVLKMVTMVNGRVGIDELYTKYGGSTFCGSYSLLKPALFVGDPDLLKQILVKDFDHFTDRRAFISENEDDKVMNESLVQKNGEEWKILRSVMSPTFTSGKMKGMFPLVCEKADVLVSVLCRESTDIEMKNKFGRFTLDTIASCVFGIECNSIESDDPEFHRKADEFFKFSVWRVITIIFFITFRRLSRFLKLRFFPPEMKFFTDVVRQTIALREKSQKRGDFIDLMLEARAHLDDKNRKVLEDEKVIVSQCVTFLVAGYETTATTLAFSSYLLAKHPKEQQRLRQEVQQMVQEHGDITYQGVMEAKFLDACIMEVLRLYPPATVSERVCTKTYVLPGTDLVVEPGIMVRFPIWSIHHDPRYWPEPEEFRPDRFMPENKANIKSFTHLPFGMGPRSCIAMRFALLQAKVALATLVLKVGFQLSPEHEELELALTGGLLKAKNGIHLVFEPLRKD